MKVEKYSGFEFWVEDASGKRIPEREPDFSYVKGAKRYELLIPVDKDLVFCIKKSKIGSRGSNDSRLRQDFVAYIMLDGRELGTVYVKRGNTKVIKIRGVFEEIDGELNCTALRLGELPTTEDTMAPQLPHELGRIALQIYRVTLKNRGARKVPLTPFRDLRRVMYGSEDDMVYIGGVNRARLYGIVRGESDLCEMEETRQKYIVEEVAGIVDRKDDPWLSMEFDYKPDFSVLESEHATLGQITALQKKVTTLEGVVGNLQRQQADNNKPQRNYTNPYSSAYPSTSTATSSRTAPTIPTHTPRTPVAAPPIHRQVLGKHDRHDSDEERDLPPLSQVGPYEYSSLFRAQKTRSRW